MYRGGSLTSVKVLSQQLCTHRGLDEEAEDGHSTFSRPVRSCPAFLRKFDRDRIGSLSKVCQAPGIQILQARLQPRF